MKTGKYSWLRKNPIVLLLRRLYQFFFKPKQNFVRFNPDYHLINAGQDIIKTETEDYLDNQNNAESEDSDDVLVTIGQLFEQVNWYNHPAIVPVESSKVKSLAKAIVNVQDRSNFDTVGELLQQVKWRMPPKVIQEQLLNNSKKLQSYDVSLN
jgi:hypothetical protein